MHISEGVLSAPVLFGGAALALGGLVRGLREINADNLPRAAILAAVFFTASLIRVPVGPSSSHLVLSGLVGLLMGWAAFPIIFLGLLLQGLLFQFGGVSTLGVNTFNMAAPAALCGVALRPGLMSPRPGLSAACALACGGLPIVISGLLVALCLKLSGEEFTAVAYLVVAANTPVAAVEALVTLFCVRFLRRVRPGLLERQALAPPTGKAGKDGKAHP